MSKKSKKEDRRGEISKYISFTLGLSFLIIGVRHYDFFGFSWKNIPLMILGLILLYTVLEADKYYKKSREKDKK